MSHQLPHILILMPDQQRADCLGAAGHPVIQTPNMDRLAREGMRFARACTVSPLCMPARASFVSGTYPHNHGMWNNAGELPARDETFFHHLQAAGYHTSYVGKSHFYEHRRIHMREREDYMHARGLDEVHETTGPWATCGTDSYMTDEWQAKGLLQKFRDDYARRRETGPCAVWPSPLPVEDHLDSYIGRQAVRWIEQYQGDKPVCLFVGFGGPHEPWDAPGDYATMYDPADMPPAIPATEPLVGIGKRAADMTTRGRIAGMSAEDIARLRANYYGKISLLDHWFGRILDAFEQRGWLDDTFVVFWSDHGEMLGDHGRLHKSVFYESALRVPLILRWPGRIPADQTSQALVENIDVFPTLLEAIGADPSPRCLGRSLWPVLRGEASAHREAVLSEVGNKTMILTERHKYALDSSGEGYLLFDLERDPREQVNWAGHPDVEWIESRLRDQLLVRLAQTQCRQPYPQPPA